MVEWDFVGVTALILINRQLKFHSQSVAKVYNINCFILHAANLLDYHLNVNLNQTQRSSASFKPTRYDFEYTHRRASQLVDRYLLYGKVYRLRSTHRTHNRFHHQ